MGKGKGKGKGWIPLRWACEPCAIATTLCARSRERPRPSGVRT